MVRRAITPGTFDPVTNGHLDIICRAASIMDEVIVGVAASVGKHPLFSLEERTRLVEEATAHLENVTVEPFDGLLVDFAREKGAHLIVKGLRALTDFEYEFQMSALNTQLDYDLETTFIMSPPEWMYLSSSIVRELASLGGDVTPFVPACVANALESRFTNGATRPSPSS